MRTAKGVPDMTHPKRGSITLLAGAMLLASSVAFANAEPAAPLQKGQPATLAKGLQQAKTYTVSSAPTAPLDLAAPKLPDLSGYTAEAIAAKIVRTKPGKISVRRMMQEDSLKDFIGGDNKMAEWVVRQHGIPQAIFVDDGYMNLKDLAKKEPKYSAKPRRVCSWRSCRSWSAARASSKSISKPRNCACPRRPVRS